MKTVTIKGFIVARKWEWDDKVGFQFNGCPLDTNGFVTVMPHEFEVELPDGFNITAAMVGSLEKSKADLRAEFNARIAQINDQISKLQCLEFTPASAS